MPSSEMLPHVCLIRTDISDERSTSIIRVTRFVQLGTMLAVTSNRRKLRRNAPIFIVTAVKAKILHVFEVVHFDAHSCALSKHSIND
jgi:hypothetical protein